MPEQQLPPDLSRLGDAITTAAERRLQARRHRSELLGRIAVTGVAAAMAFAILFPGALTDSEPPGGALQLVSSSATYVPTACDQPRGATLSAARPCAVPGTTDVATDVLGRRYAMQ
jgi:hypothetical protein